MVLYLNKVNFHPPQNAFGLVLLKIIEHTEEVKNVRSLKTDRQAKCHKTPFRCVHIIYI